MDTGLRVVLTLLLLTALCGLADEWKNMKKFVSRRT